jgi:hypothetical protein
MSTITQAKIAARVHRIAASVISMVEAERQVVKDAIKAGARVLGYGRLHDGGPLVLTVEKPLQWAGTQRSLDCTIAPEAEAATIRWANRLMAAEAEHLAA